MANRQQLIHLHSANVNETPFQSLKDTGFQAGEIAIQYAASKPKLFILDDTGAVREFIDKVAIETLVSGVAGDVETLEGRVTTLETTVGDETKGLVKGLADEAKRAKDAEEANAAGIAANATAISGEVTRAEDAEAALDGKIDDVEAAYKAADTALGARIDGVDAAYKAADTALGNRIKAFETDGAHDVAALEGRVGANEAAITKLNGADSVEGSVAYKVKAEADRAKAAEKENADDIAAEVTRAEGKEAELNTAIGKVETDYKAADAQTLVDAKAYTDTKVSSVYRVMGSCTHAELIAMDDQIKGNVWNVTDASTHEGVKYPVGTNFVYIADTSGQTGESVWDALGGTVDLSTYALKTEVQTVASDLAAEVVRATAAEGANASAISAEVTRAEDAEADLDERLNTIEGDDTVDGSIKKALKDAKAYTDAEQTRATAAEQANANAIAGEVTRATTAEQALDAKIEAIKTTGMTVVDKANAGISVSFDGTNKYNVGLVIDPANDFLKIDTAKGLQVVGVATASGLTAVENSVSALETSVSGLEDDLEEEVARAKAAEGANASAISTNASAIAAEETRATGAEGDLGTRITNEVNRATSAETDNANAITAEVTRATTAEDKKIDNVVVSNLTGVTATSAIADHVRTTTINFANMVINCGEF